MRSALRKGGCAGLVLLSLAACLDSVEPTAQSSSVSITPKNASGVELARTSIVSASFQIGNTSGRQIFVDRNYRRLEKLVDQRWKVAAEQVGTFSIPPSSVGPGQIFVRSETFIQDRQSSIQYPLLDHVRGVYRLRFRISFKSDGGDLLPEEESYSRPFGVSCC